MRTRLQGRWRSARDGEAADKSVGEKGSEVGYDILDGEMAEEKVLRAGKPHGQRAQEGRRITRQMLIGRSGQPAWALELGSAGHCLGWHRFLS